MEAPHLERKLVAILAADIEGFSSHMERDEAGTLAVLSSHRLIIDASIAEFGGRPDGPFNVLARTRRDALITVDESAVPAKEDTLAVELAFWEAAKDSGSPLELEAYLERFPDGEFVELAQARLESLRESAT